MTAQPGSSPFRDTPSAHDTVELAPSGLHQFGYAFAIVCCVLLAVGPSLALAELLPYPVLQIGAAVIALAGLAVSRDLFGRSRLTVGPDGLRLSSPAFGCEWSDLELSQISSARAPKRPGLFTTMRWQGYLELYPRDVGALTAAYPQTRRLTSRRQPGIVRISLQERPGLATAVDQVMTRYGRPGYQGIVGDPL